MPNKLPKFLDNHKICIICEGNEEFEYLKRLKILISQRGIRTDIKMEQMNLCLCSVIRKRNLTSNMRTLNAKLMSFMVWIVQRMK